MTGCLSDPQPRPLPPEWLRVADGRIRLPDGLPLRGRGANIFDTRSCDACSYEPPHPDEVERRIDELVDGWGADFLRLDLESHSAADAGARVHWGGILDDPDYLADVESTVRHITAKPGVYVVVSPWIDATFDEDRWPTEATMPELTLLAERFADNPRVLFAVASSPDSADATQDAELAATLAAAVAAVRAGEAAAGGPPHVVLVPALRGGTSLDYFLADPIDDPSVAYMVQGSVAAQDLDARFANAAADLPVVIGGFGPGGSVTLDDCTALMDRAEAVGVPWLAWAFHMRCPPNLLVDNTSGGCGAGMDLIPTEWGVLVRSRLQIPWGG